ncbi:suppressor of fused domain protein [Corynebacterium phoceense]
MNAAETQAWLANIIPAPLRFENDLAYASLDNDENLVATTRFAEVSTGLSAEGMDVRAEILTVARAPLSSLAALITEATELLDAARVIPAQPGTLLPKLGPGRHGVLVAPWLWGGPTPQVKMDGRWTLMLQLVALTDSEYAYAVEEGVPALQDAVAESEIDLLDWSRFES